MNTLAKFYAEMQKAVEALANPQHGISVVPVWFMPDRGLCGNLAAYCLSRGLGESGASTVAWRMCHQFKMAGLNVFQ